MLKIITSLSMFLVGALAQSQVSENRTVASFSKVVVNDGVEVIVTLDASQKLVAQASDALSLNDLITEVKNGVLYVETRDALDAPAKVLLSIADLRAVELLGMSKMSVTNAIVASEFSVSLSGRSLFTGDINADALRLNLKAGSHFNGNVVAKTLVADLRTGSQARLSGFANKASFNAVNHSVCNARRLYTDTTSIKAAGDSNVMANADDNLDIDIAQGSQASWAGYPETVKLPEDAQIVPKPNTAVSGL